jgi:enoyl-[acyl-carrier protein] reductase/trans-2-enoyl-CoA reductase (NAD+)
MPALVITPRVRGFICLTAHPTGCAVNVRKLVAHAETHRTPSAGWKNVLVIGSSTGYGLASLANAVFGYGSRAVSVCLERPPRDETTASAGYYNLSELHRIAAEREARVSTIVGDAFLPDTKRQVVDELCARFGKLDLIVYSVAAPKRTDPATGVTYASALKPIGAPYNEKTIQVDRAQVVPITVPAASEAEIFATTKVMGGDDWALWIEALAEADLLSPGCRTVAYSYIGPRITDPIYRSGTLGRAKEHLESSAKALDARMAAACGGRAWVSIQQALVTQASAAIPVLPLYISLLLRCQRERGEREGTAEQIGRLFADHLCPEKTPKVDELGRIRLDDREMNPELQRVIDQRWDALATENLDELSDLADYKRQFRQLFGFEVEGVDYDKAVEIATSLAPT